MEDSSSLGAPRTEDRYFRCAPSSARKRTLGYFLAWYGTLGVIGIVSFLGSTPMPLAIPCSVALGLFVVWGATRAARVAITASGERVAIANQFRTYVLRWDEIDRIELSQLPGYLGSYVPALAFCRNARRRVKAQAVATSRWEQESMLKDWRRIAPRETVVDLEVDKHRPQPLLRPRK
jgi:hypothetical protein